MFSELTKGTGTKTVNATSCTCGCGCGCKPESAEKKGLKGGLLAGKNHSFQTPKTSQQS